MTIPQGVARAIVPIAVEQDKHARTLDRLDAREFGPNIGEIVAEYLSLPELRAFWTMSSVNESGNALDLSGQARTLTNNATTPRGVYLEYTPYFDFTPGSSQYLSRASEAGLNISGALTLALWTYLDAATTGTLEAFGGKWNTTGNQRSYVLMGNATPAVVGRVSSNGTAETSVTSTVTLALATWYFIALR